MSMQLSTVSFRRSNLDIEQFVTESSSRLTDVEKGAE